MKATFKRVRLKIIGFTTLLLLFILGCANMNKNTQPKNKIKVEKPNIVLINVDDLGWKDLGFMGSQYYETPNIDALATQGLIFENAYAAASNCAPSRACMLSGLNTPRHGVYTVNPSERGNPKTRKIIPVPNTPFLADHFYTLPEMLKNAGYVTGSFGKWHIGKDPHTQGIDINIGGSERGNPGIDGYFSPYNLENITDGPKGEYLTDRLTMEAISFVQKYKDTSFFLYLPYYTVYTPIQGKTNLIKRFTNKKANNGQDNMEYAAMIASVDENVGKLMATLESLHLVKKTILIFTSDNGGVRAISSQNPLRGGKGSYYEGGIKVPLIIKWPGKIAENTKSDYRVSQLDFYPTLQNILNPDKRNNSLDGRDLMPLFVNQKTVERDLFFHFPIYLEAYNSNKDDSRDPLFRTRPGSVIISGNWKLHHFYEDNAWELYDLKADPGERKNLFHSNPEKAKILQKKLSRWLEETKAPIPTQKNPAFDSTFQNELLQKLVNTR